MPPNAHKLWLLRIVILPNGLAITDRKHLLDLVLVIDEPISCDAAGFTVTSIKLNIPIY